MVTVPQLLNLKITDMEAAADGWLGVASKLNNARDSFTNAVATPLKDQKWKGKAGDTAAKICENLRLDIEAVAIEATAAQKFLDDMAAGSGDGFGNLRTHQQNLMALNRAAVEQGFSIREDGTVHWAEVRAAGPATAEEHQRMADRNAQAKAMENKVREVLKVVTEIDDTLARGLKVIFGKESTFRTEHRGRRTEGGLIDSAGDELVGRQLAGVYGVLLVKGWNDAANLLKHYLEGSGKPYEIDADRLLADVPRFQADVTSTLDNVRGLPDGPFETEWTNTNSPHDQNLNWYYGLNNFDYRLVGEKNGDQITYHVEVQKRYDWGIPSEHRRDLERFPVDLEQAEIARLNMTGDARDFDVHGRTGTRTVP